MTISKLVEGIISGSPDLRVLNPVTAGRGTVFFARLEGLGEMVLRVYRHGGILGGILRDRFFSPKRFVRELFVTEAARNAGVTLLEPLGVAYRRNGWGVKGVWISRRIAGGITLRQWMLSYPPVSRFVVELAQVIAAMHRSGIGHADLTVQNIMVVQPADSGPFLSVIDFDKAVIRSVPKARDRMKQLRRLDRSLLKWIPENSPWRTPMMRLRFAVTYCKAFPETRPLMEAYIRRFKMYEYGYHLGWVVQRLLGGSKKRR